MGAIYIIFFFLLSNYIILNLFIGAILANMGTDTDDDRIMMTNKKKAEKMAAQLRARSAQVFANSKFTDWKKGGCKGNLAELEEVMALDFAIESFEDCQTPPVRFGRPVTNTTYFIFDPYHPARRFFYNLVKNPIFDSFILFIIIWSTLNLALDNPTSRKDPFWNDMFNLLDDIFLIIFTFEFLFKTFAFGLIWSDNIEFMLADQNTLKDLVLGDTGEPAIMYSGWNYLDITVLFVGYVNKLGISQLKILKLVRAFRPLRMVNRIAGECPPPITHPYAHRRGTLSGILSNPCLSLSRRRHHSIPRLAGMKLVLGALVAACPALANVCILLVAVFLIFAILGLSLFAGKFFSCNNEDATGCCVAPPWHPLHVVHVHHRCSPRVTPALSSVTLPPHLSSSTYCMPSSHSIHLLTQCIGSEVDCLGPVDGGDGFIVPSVWKYSLPSLLSHTL